MPRNTTLEEPWLSMAKAAGGVDGLARAFRAGNMTLYRWARGQQTPHPIIRDAVNAWAVKRGIVAPFPNDDLGARPPAKPPHKPPKRKAHE